MNALLMGLTGAIWLVVGGLLLVLALAVVLTLVFATYIVGPLFVLLVVLAPIAVYGARIKEWLTRRPGEAAAPAVVPSVERAAEPAIAISNSTGGRAMQERKSRVGWIETGILAWVAVLIVGEVIAIYNGIGPYFAVVALGYVLVLGLCYMLYVQVRSSRARQAEIVTAATQEITTPIPDGHILKRVDIFQGLNDEQISRVAALRQTFSISSGHQLGIAGEQGERVYIVLEGMAQLTASSGIGDITVRIAGPGESFPLASLVASGVLITSIRAMTDMSLMTIPRDQLLELCRENPDVGMKIYAAVAQILGDRYSRTLARLTTTAEKALRDTGFFANV
jgi:hypothetical protein